MISFSSWYNQQDFFVVSMRGVFRGMKTEITQSNESGQFTMMRSGKNLSDMDRTFDVEFWQRQSDTAIFDAAWEMVECYLRDRGIAPDEYRLQRTIENFQRTRS